MSKTFIVIDGDNLCHRNYHAMKTSPHPERAVAIGMLRDIVTLHDVLGSANFLFCFDCGLSVRKNHYPLYKSRPETEERRVIRGHIQYLRDTMLPRMGFVNVFSEEFYEADDLIAFLIRSGRGSDTYYIVSNDEDMLQLLAPNVVIWNPYKKVILTEKWFQKTYGMPPRKWIDFKSLTGCVTDSITGVSGEATALKYLKGTLGEGAYMDRIRYGWDIISRNGPLVTLPFPHLEDPVLVIGKDSITEVKWRRECQRIQALTLLMRSPWRDE